MKIKSKIISTVLFFSVVMGITVLYKTQGKNSSTLQNVRLIPKKKLVEIKLKSGVEKLIKDERIQFACKKESISIRCISEASHCGGGSGCTLSSETKTLDCYQTNYLPEPYTCTLLVEAAKMELPLIEEMEISIAFKVYPNPVQTQCTIELENYNNESWSFELYDLSGKLLMQQNPINVNIFNFSKGNLPAGIFIYRINYSQSGMPKLKSGKLVVE